MLMTDFTPDPRRPSRPAISCVVPAFNEAANLAPLLTGLTAQLAELSDRWEVLVIDDGSQDATPATIRRTPASGPSQRAFPSQATAISSSGSTTSSPLRS